MKDALPLATHVLLPLGLTAAVSSIDTEIQKNILLSKTTKQLISGEELKDTMEIIKSLKDSGLLIKRYY